MGKDLGNNPFKLDASGKDKIIHHYGMELRLLSSLHKDKILRDLLLKMLVLMNLEKQHGTLMENIRKDCNKN